MLEIHHSNNSQQGAQRALLPDAIYSVACQVFLESGQGTADWLSRAVSSALAATNSIRIITAQLCVCKKFPQKIHLFHRQSIK